MSNQYNTMDADNYKNQYDIIIRSATMISYQCTQLQHQHCVNSCDYPVLCDDSQIVLTQCQCIAHRQVELIQFLVQNWHSKEHY